MIRNVILVIWLSRSFLKLNFPQRRHVHRSTSVPSRSLSFLLKFPEDINHYWSTEFSQKTLYWIDPKSKSSVLTDIWLIENHTARISGNEKSFFYLEFLPIHYLCLWKLTIMFPILVFNGHYVSHADFLMTTIPKTETEMSQRH